VAEGQARLLKQRDFTPTMTTSLILKDIDLMLAAAQANGVEMPLTTITRELMRTLMDEGHGEEDYMSIVKLAEKRSGLSVPVAARSDDEGRSRGYRGS
jgi:3-hydroxyisobutyrate dehydrogenase